MDDEDLNANMARSDDELILFNQMDADRAADPDYGPGKKLGRLMGESELPDIYLDESNPVQETVEEYVGRGARERTKVRYDDGLTEEQWLMAVDDDEDTIENAIARKTARIEKRQANKDKRARTSTGGVDESSPLPSRESSEEPEPPPPPPKKRGRKSNPTKRKAEEDLAEETPPTKKKRGRGAKSNDTLAPTHRTNIQKVLESVYQHLMDLEEPVEGEVDEDGEPMMRGLIDPFIKLVPKNLYPDYYIVITNPIAMEQIQKKINKHEYQTLKEFVADIRLLFNNARTYNEDGSQLYIDANNIEVSFFKSMNME
jgi:ATP-dependent helicase STH1/SNF2